jgi:hypothetical protein
MGSVHPYIAAHIIGKEFGIAPHEVLEWPAEHFSRTIALMGDLAPKEQ